MGVFGGVEKVRALGANGVAKGSTLGVWFEVGSGMVVEEALEQALCLFEFRGFSSFNGKCDEEEVEGVGVGRRGLLPLDLNQALRNKVDHREEEDIEVGVRITMIDDHNITMEEYIKLEEEKAHRRGRVFNWQTAPYGKIRIDDDLHDLSSVEAEFLAIVINDAFAPQNALQYKSQNEFPAIVYNDAQTSKSDLLTESILNPRHINEFNLNNETSVSEYDEEEQNILYFNDIFPFNIIRLDDLNLEKDNNDNDIDIIQSSEDMALPPRKQRHCFLRYEGLEYFDADITDFEARLARIYRREVHRVHVFDFRGLPDLMAEGLSARMLMEHQDDQGVSLFTSRAWRRHFDIRGLLIHELILEFYSTFRFGHTILDLDTLGTLQFQLGEARRRMSWREFILALGLHTDEEMQTTGFSAYWTDSMRQIPNKGDLRDYWRGISSAGDLLGTAPSYTMIRDPILRLCHRLIAYSIAGRSQTLEKVTVMDLFYLRGIDVDSVNVPYLLARYLRLFTARRKSGAHISRGRFVARLAEHFGLLTKEILGGLMVIARKLLIVDMAELVRMQICTQFDDTWAWVAMGPERQPDATAGALAIAEDAPVVDEGDQTVLTPGLRRDVGSLRGLVERSITDQGRLSTWMMTCMTQLMDASGLTYQAFNQTFRGSSPLAFQRRTRQRTDGASTSTAQQDPQQPDP
ncbi:hypothetical protein Tco_0514239 [Tanacetum coccineum]